MFVDSKLEIYSTKRGWHWKVTVPPRPGKKKREVVARGGEPFASRYNAMRAFNKARKHVLLAKEHQG